MKDRSVDSFSDCKASYISDKSDEKAAGTCSGGKIHLCLLASGNASRFGSNKLLCEYRGKPLYRHGYDVLSAVSERTGAELHVVSRYKEILSNVRGGIDCPESEFGMSYTIRAAVNACGEVADSDRILFLVADQPNITPETVLRVLDVKLAERPDSSASLSHVHDEKPAEYSCSPAPVAACTFDGENPGNPIVFAGFLAQKLLSLSGDRGGRSILKDCPDRVAKVLCRKEELQDIDTVEDL